MRSAVGVVIGASAGSDGAAECKAIAPPTTASTPLAVRNLLIVAALGAISLITLLLGMWSRQDLIAVIAWPSICSKAGPG